MAQSTPTFQHEKLEVYQEAISFIAWLSTFTEAIERPGDVRSQLDRASTSIALNLAEGNGKYALRDRCRFFDISHGSALECAAGLDVLVAKGKLSPEHAHQGKVELNRIVQLLMGLIKSNSSRKYGLPVWAAPTTD